MTKSAFWRSVKKDAEGWLLAAPFVVLFAIFVVVPVIWGFILSFTHYNIIQPMRFAGLSNYLELFTNDDLFLKAVSNTLTFAVVSGPVGFIMSFFFAWVVSQLKFRSVYTLALYAPSIISGIAVSVVWLTLFSPDRNGYINNALIASGVVQQPIRWTSDPKYIMLVIIIITLWMSLGTGFLTNIAGVAGVNPELFEAGKIDGVRNKFQELVYITLPQMKPQLLFNAIMATVGSLNVFDMAAQIGGFPSPDYAAYTIVGHMNDYAFIRFELGYASAVAFVLFLMNFILGRVFMKVLSSEGE